MNGLQCTEPHAPTPQGAAESVKERAQSAVEGAKETVRWGAARTALRPGAGPTAAGQPPALV